MRISKFQNYLKKTNSTFWILSFIFSLYQSPAQAEYRVFVLKITQSSKDPNIPSESRTFESTLDPDQYRGYYPLNENENITYINTWRCFGRTNQRPHCPDPKIPINSTEGLDSTSNPPN